MRLAIRCRRCGQVQRRGRVPARTWFHGDPTRRVPFPHEHEDAEWVEVWELAAGGGVRIEVVPPAKDWRSLLIEEEV